jgi:hypothetical protein
MIDQVLQQLLPQQKPQIPAMPKPMQEAAYSAHMQLNNPQLQKFSEEQRIELMLMQFGENIVRQCALQARLALLDEEKVDQAILKYYNLQ